MVKLSAVNKFQDLKPILEVRSEERDVCDYSQAGWEKEGVWREEAPCRYIRRKKREFIMSSKVMAETYVSIASRSLHHGHGVGG